MTQRYQKKGGYNTYSKRGLNKSSVKNETSQQEELIKTYLDVIQNKNCVLDFGCGIGRMTKFLSENFKRYYGTDIVQSVIESADRFRIPNTKFELLNSFNNNIPFGNTKFDVIWTSTVLQHVVDDKLLKHYIKDFYRRLNKDGYVLILENTGNHKNSNYLSFRSKAEYIGMFDQVRFEIIDSECFDAAGENHTIILFRKK